MTLLLHSALKLVSLPWLDGPTNDLYVITVWMHMHLVVLEQQSSGHYANIDVRDLEPRNDITGLLALKELLSGLKHVHLNHHIMAAALGWQHHVCVRLGQNINDLTNTTANTCTY
jgi:hypothetical protein